MLNLKGLNLLLCLFEIQYLNVPTDSLFHFSISIYSIGEAIFMVFFENSSVCMMLRDPLVENSQTAKTHLQIILILAFLWFQRFWHELTNFELVTICTDWSWSLVFSGVLVSSSFGKISCLRISSSFAKLALRLQSLDGELFLRSC